MMHVTLLCGLGLLTLSPALAQTPWTKTCTSASDCIGQTIECAESRDCVVECMDEGVCANSTFVCSQSTAFECDVRCAALDSCFGASLQSERHTSLKCAESACTGLWLEVGRVTDNLTLNASCDAPHSCFHSRLQLHSEGGAATVVCTDSDANHSHACEDSTLVCHMTATGHCEASAGGQNACDDADANTLLCANSELCAAGECFTQWNTVTLSFLISNGPLNSSTDCATGVRLAAGSEVPANGPLACASLSDAMAKCNALTQTAALVQWAQSVGLSTDLSNAVVDSCEFLFATFDGRQPVEVAATGQLEVEYDYGFEAKFYPWQYSVNSALRNRVF